MQPRATDASLVLGPLLGVSTMVEAHRWVAVGWGFDARCGGWLNAIAVPWRSLPRQRSPHQPHVRPRTAAGTSPAVC
jgi:hypothetical protein